MHLQSIDNAFTAQSPGQQGATHVLCAAADIDVKNPQEDMHIGEAYRQLWQVVKLPAVQKFALVLLTFRYKLVLPSIFPCGVVFPLGLPV